MMCNGSNFMNLELDKYKNVTTKTEFRNGLMDSKLFCVLSSIPGALGLVGNLLILVVLLKNKIGAFTLLLISLTLSDTLFIISMISAHYIGTYNANRIPGLMEWFLPIVQCSMGISSGVSSYIGMERFFAIYKPILHRSVSTKNTNFLVLATIYCINVGLSVAEGTGVLSNYQGYARFVGELIRRYIPSILILISNTVTGILLTRYSKIRKTLSSSSKKELTITKTMFVVVVTYFICMLPGSIHLLLIDTGAFCLGKLKVLFRIGYCLEIINASCNFIIYILTSEYYKQKFREHFCVF